MTEEKKDELTVARPTVPVKYDPNDAVSLYMNESIFVQLQRVAMLMAKSKLVPQHLQGQEKVADCFLVAAQAFRWKMDPFAVAQSSYVVSGKVGYEGKLVAAIVNAQPQMARKLNYKYSGTGNDRKVVVSGRLRGEDEDRTVEGSLAEWATNNKQWRDGKDQMLAYRGAREWARRHMPEAVLGVQSIDEVQDIAASQEAPKPVESLDDLLPSASVEGEDDPPEYTRGSTMSTSMSTTAQDVVEATDELADAVTEAMENAGQEEEAPPADAQPEEQKLGGKVKVKDRRKKGEKNEIDDLFGSR